MSAGAPSDAGSSASAPVRYVVERGVITLAFPTRRASLSGALGGVDGTIELSPSSLEQSHASLRADLLTLTLSKGAGASDPAVVAEAFDWLELSAEHDRGERARNRYAEFDLRSLERADGDDAERRTTRLHAFGDLTLHHFRVPITLELDMSPTAEPGQLSIRTRRPLVVALASHDILPRDAHGTILTQKLGKLGRDTAREVHVTAELLVRQAARTQQDP